MAEDFKQDYGNPPSLWIHPGDRVCSKCGQVGKWKVIGGFAEVLTLRCLDCGYETFTMW